MNHPKLYSMKRTLNLDFDDADTRVREALEPVVQLGVANDPKLVPLAEEVRGALARVLDAVEKAG